MNWKAKRYSAVILGLWLFVPAAAVSHATAEQTQAERGTLEGAFNESLRRLPLEGAVNFRDLGGYPAADGRRIRWGVLYRSDALDSLTNSDVELLRRLNIAVIADFRGPSEVAKRPDRLPEDLAGKYTNLPIDGAEAQGDPEEATRMEAARIAWASAMRDPSKARQLAEIDRLFAEHYYPRLPRYGKTSYKLWLHSLMEAPHGSSHIFHCAAGMDRTGFASAILLLTLGVPKRVIIDDYLLTNSYWFSESGLAFQEKKGLSMLPREFQLRAGYLEAALQAAEGEYGTLDNYLREGLGIDDATKQALRERYLE